MAAMHWCEEFKSLLTTANDIRIVKKQKQKGGNAIFVRGRLSGYCLAHTESSPEVRSKGVRGNRIQLPTMQEFVLTLKVHRAIVRVII